jgi:hypothetical protein
MVDGYTSADSTAAHVIVPKCFFLQNRRRQSLVFSGKKRFVGGGGVAADVETPTDETVALHAAASEYQQRVLPDKLADMVCG